MKKFQTATAITAFLLFFAAASASDAEAISFEGILAFVITGMLLLISSVLLRKAAQQREKEKAAAQKGLFLVRESRIAG